MMMENKMRPVLNIAQLTDVVRDELHARSQDILYENKMLRALRKFQSEMTTDDLIRLQEGLREALAAIQTVKEQFGIASAQQNER
jgi:hypothetical protein